MKFGLPKWKKESFGYGSLAGEDELNNDLTKALSTQAAPTSRFNQAVSSMVNKIVMTGLGPWLSSVFMKYPPVAFHQRMSNGFDFVVDLRTNHYAEFQRYIAAARGMRSRGVLQLNTQALYSNITGMMAKRGYMLNPLEAQVIFKNINEIVQMIYSP
jgi:hypothetical protein